MRPTFKSYLASKRHGFWIDLIFVMLSVFVLPRIGYILQRLFAQSIHDLEGSLNLIGGVIIITFLWRWISVYLKRFSFEARSDKTERSIGIFWLAYLPTTLLSIAFVILGIGLPLKEAGIVDILEGEIYVGTIALFLIGIEAWLLFRLNPEEGSGYSKNNWRYLRSTELFADIGIFAYIFVWQCFYNFYLVGITKFAFKSATMFGGFLIISIVVFSFFYLGPRLLLLMEDGKRYATWLRILAIFIVSFVSHLLMKH